MSTAIVIRLIGDASQLQRSLNQAQTGMEKFKARVGIAAAGIATAGIALGTASVKAAADQSANFSKYEQITKKAMDATAKETARGLNLSQSSYADYYAQLSAMYQSNGIGVKDANRMAAEAMTTAADAAAFGNTTVGEAVEAQLGLLKGSGELLEKYSVSIKASDISARMKAKGLDKLKGAELKAAEAATRHAIAQEKSKIFLGQAAKESGSLESRQQRLAATVEDMKAKLGERLLPTVEKFIGKLQSMADWIEQNQTKTKIILGVIGALAGVVLAAALAIKAYQAAMMVARVATAAHTAAMWLLNAAFLANPVGLVVIGLVALAAIFVVLWKKSETFRRIVTAAFNAVKNAASAVWNWIKNNWPLLLAIITGPIGLAVAAVVKLWDQIKAGAQNAWSAIKEGATAARDWIVSRFTDVVSFITGLPGKIGDATKLLAQKGIDVVQGFINGLKEKAKELPGIVKDAILSPVNVLLPKGLEIGSPSKLTARYGRWVGEGFVRGIKGSKDAVAAAMEQLTERLRAKVDAAKDLARGIREAFRVDLSATDVEGKGPTLLSRLRKQAAEAEAFTKRIQQLRKAGLRGSVLEQLTAEGPSSLAAADEIAANVKDVNRLAARIAAAGTALANSETKARTGISMTAPVVNVSVQLDGKELRAIAKAEVLENNRKTKTAVKAGARRAG